MLYKFLSLALFFSILSCTHRPPFHHLNSLFPPRTYKHSVRVEALDLPAMSFRGVLSLSANELKIYLLGPMDITAAKVVENFPQETLDVSVHIPQLQSYEKQMESLYEVLRSFILFPRDKTEWGLLHFQEDVYKGPHQLAISVQKVSPKDYHPTQFTITHPKFTVKVEEIP